MAQRRLVKRRAPFIHSQFELPSRRRSLGLLSDQIYFGPQFEQTGGHLRVSSDQPLVIFALFGDLEGRYLAAIQGQGSDNADSR